MPGSGPTAADSAEYAGVSAAAPGGRGRRRFRLRVHIATLFVLLIAAAGLAIVSYGYVATSGLLLSAGDAEFLHAVERTTAQVGDLLDPARLLVQLLTRHSLTTARSLRARLDSLPLLTTALAEHPEISAVYVGFESGDFFLVRPLAGAVGPSLNAPPGAGYLVQSVATAEGPVPGRYLFLDGQLDVLRDEPRPSYRFDPRTREWYRQALSSASAVRTRPYVFFTTREVGTTVAQRSAHGASVVGADITLQELSRQLARSRLTPSARIALVDGDGIVVAHPDAARLLHPGTGQDPGLSRLGDLGDRVLLALFATHASAPAPGATRATHEGHSFSVDGRKWVGVKRSIGVSAGEPLTLLLAVPRDELVAGARGLAQRQVLIGIGVVAVTLGLVWLSARRVSRPLEALARSVERIGGGDLDTPLPEVWNPLEVGALRDATDRMRSLIKDHIVERAARLAEAERRARELEIARQIQLSMLPSPPTEPLDGRFAVAATLRPAREVGGDLYDFLLLDGHRLVFAIGDVADKGVPAALLMARVTGLFRAITRSDAGPAEILRELDQRLSQGNDTAMFVTMACAELDGETGALRYASAGHDPAVLRKADGTTVRLPVDGGAALGLALGSEFRPWTGRLDAGDTLVLTTDGVTEAFDAGGVAFGPERLRQIVASTPLEAIASLPDRLVGAVERFSAGGGPRDDLAVLAVQFQPGASTAGVSDGRS